MEPPSAPPQPRSTVLFAIVAIVLLVAGLGAGYYLGQPAPVSPPGPVNDLARVSTIPRVDGWYRNASVSYLDYGPQPNVALPILVFFQAASPSTPVAGQRNIIDTIPGQPGYSDFWQVYKVLAPSGYVANTIRSLADAVASGYAIEMTDVVVNCPVVNPNATISGSSATPVLGWYRNRDVFYFDEGTRSPSDGSVVRDAPLYAFFHADGTAVAGQKNVIDALPGDADYSDLWEVVKVVVGTTYVANSLKDARSILAARDSGQVTLEPTTIYVNCPVVS
ncbi:MAG: DUF7482 domain-containing protein [Thermoplasmata archaeon]